MKVELVSYSQSPNHNKTPIDIVESAASNCYDSTVKTKGKIAKHCYNSGHLEEKAKVVAVVMNRVRSNLFPNNIWDVIHQQGQFEDSNTSCWDLSNSQYSNKVTDSVKQAVDYYFNNSYAFDDSIMYFYGDGKSNYFY